MNICVYSHIFIFVVGLYCVGCLGGMLLSIVNTEHITFNPFSQYFVLQIIFGSFIALIIVTLSDPALSR